MGSTQSTWGVHPDASSDTEQRRRLQNKVCRNKATSSSLNKSSHNVRDHDHRLPVLFPRLGLRAVQQLLLVPGPLRSQGRDVQVPQLHPDQVLDIPEVFKSILQIGEQM